MLLQRMLSEFSRVPYHMLILGVVDIIDLVYVLCKVEEDVWVVLVVSIFYQVKWGYQFPM